MIKVPNHKVSIETLYETIKCLNLGFSSDNDLAKTASYVGVSVSCIKDSIKTLQMLEIVNDSYELNVNTKKIIEKYQTKTNAVELLKEILLGWKPFVLFLSYRKQGYSDINCIAKINFFYEIDKKDLLLSIINKWIKELNIVTEVNDTCNAQDYQLLDIQYSNNIYLCELLSDDVYNFIDDDVKNNLLNALSSFNIPEKSISDTGKAYEDFLRLIDKSKNSTLSSANGISQLANDLKSKNIIHQKLNKLSEAIGDIRNMVGHSKEKDTQMSWKLTRNGAIVYLHFVANTLSSIYSFVFNGIQMF